MDIYVHEFYMERKAYIQMYNVHGNKIKIAPIRFH